MPNQLYTVSVYTENRVGLLNQISIIFTRRKLNIETLTVSASAVEGIHKFTITTYAESEELMQQLVSQIEKKVDVIKAFYYHDDEIIHQEVALFKVDIDNLLDNDNVETLVRKHNARILEVNRTFAVIEKTGRSDETQLLYDELSCICTILQFVRSGRIAITKSTIELVNEFLLAQKERENRILNE